MKIGVFDSGNGAKFVAQKLQTLIPEHEYIVVNDPEHAPYGERTYADIRALTHAAIAPLIDQCEIIVIACNTATAAAIESLRQTYPDTTFVGFEPMVKPAAELTHTGHFTLLATHATAHSTRTNQLIENYAAGLRIDIPDTTGWARAIDHESADAIDLESVRQSIADGSDTIIIGCTHYIALQSKLESLGATVLEPTEAVARQLQAEVTRRAQR